MIETLSSEEFLRITKNLVNFRPLVHCITNEVVQEITANVLLASGASPAMCVGEQEVGEFAKFASGILINTGTPYDDRIHSMKLAIISANEKNIPWVLDPVAAGLMHWRDSVINDLVEMGPTVIRGNASEILALAGIGKGGKGVDSLDSSDVAIEAAKTLAKKINGIVTVTGATDYITNGERIIKVDGGHILATLVVGTGCSLSALVAAYCGVEKDYLLAASCACKLAKKSQEKASKLAKGPGSFHNEYLDALYTITKECIA